ncbi:MAG: Ca2+-dependent phosphoinositide-specific phospholipase C [Chitinophagales bacterium]
MRYVLSVFALIVILSGCKHERGPTQAIINPQDDSLQLNQIQILASHNSYHRHTDSAVYAALQNLKSSLPPQYDPDGLDYEHLPFDQQMTDYGIRGLEIDIYNDPQGGVFYRRKMNELIGTDPVSHIYSLLLPGFKVLHIKDVDYNSHYNTFREALWAVRNWSEANPNHVPLFINIESKQDGPAQNAQLAALGFQPAPVYNAAAADELDREIKSVFGEQLDKVITPDKVRNGASTLNEVAVQHRWPKLGDCRGKVVFIMQGNAVPFYLAGHPSLQGRAMFTYADPGDPEAAFVIMNDPTGDFDTIQSLVRRGYIVRTRADADTEQARTGDYTDANNAYNSGAQIVSTDYYRADPRSDTSAVWTTYHAQLPGCDHGRKNPVSAATVRVSEALLE